MLTYGLLSLSTCKRSFIQNILPADNIVSALKIAVYPKNILHNEVMNMLPCYSFMEIWTFKMLIFLIASFDPLCMIYFQVMLSRSLLIHEAERSNEENPDQFYDALAQKCLETPGTSRKACDFKCYHCDEEFQIHADLKRHKLTCNRTLFFCSICGKDYKSATARDYHKGKVHGVSQKIYRCPECCRKMFSKQNFICHMKFEYKRQYNCS